MNVHMNKCDQELSNPRKISTCPIIENFWFCFFYPSTLLLKVYFSLPKGVEKKQSQTINTGILGASTKSSNNPPFTIAELEKAIPAHCFERSMSTSFKYVGIDLFAASVLFYFATWIPSFSLPLQIVLWPIYWVIQGFNLMGLVCIWHYQSIPQTKFCGFNFPQA